MPAKTNNAEDKKTQGKDKMPEQKLPYSADYLEIDPIDLLPATDDENIGSVIIRYRKRLLALYDNDDVINCMYGRSGALDTVMKNMTIEHNRAMDRLVKAQESALTSLANKQSTNADYEEKRKALIEQHQTQKEALCQTTNTFLKQVEYNYHNAAENFSIANMEARHKEDSFATANPIAFASMDPKLVANWNNLIPHAISKKNNHLYPRNFDPRSKAYRGRQKTKRTGLINADNTLYTEKHFTQTLRLGAYVSRADSGLFASGENLFSFISNNLFPSGTHVVVDNVKTEGDPPKVTFEVHIPENFNDREKITAFTDVYAKLAAFKDPKDPTKPLITTFNLTDIKNKHGKDVALAVAKNLFIQTGNPDLSFSCFMSNDTSLLKAKVQGLTEHQNLRAANGFGRNPNVESAIVNALMDLEQLDKSIYAATKTNLDNFVENIFKDYYSNNNGANLDQTTIQALTAAVNQFTQQFGENSNMNLSEAITYVQSYYNQLYNPKASATNNDYDPSKQVTFFSPPTDGLRADEKASLSGIGEANEARPKHGLLTAAAGNSANLVPEKQEEPANNKPRPGR